MPVSPESVSAHPLLSAVCQFFWHKAHEARGGAGDCRPICSYRVRRTVAPLSRYLLKMCVGVMRKKTKGVHSKDCSNVPWGASWEMLLGQLCEGNPRLLPRLASVEQCVCERNRCCCAGSTMATVSFCRCLSLKHITYPSLTVEKC